MIPTSFDYHKPSSVDEAISMLAGDEDAKILAGGHSLIPAMKLRLNAPSKLIDISRLSELNFIREEGDEIVIGAATTHGQIASSSLLTGGLAVVAQTAGMIGDIQVRNKGTIGGSIAHADPAADWPAAILAVNARIVMKGSSGTRSVAAEDFFTGFFETALEEGEIITQIRIPKAGAGATSAYAKFAQPASRFAIVGCAAVVNKSGGSIQSARVAITGASEAAYRAKAVEQMLMRGASIEDAANAAAEDVSIMSDHYAGEEYRKHLAKVFVRRALEAC